VLAVRRDGIVEIEIGLGDPQLPEKEPGFVDGMRMRPSTARTWASDSTVSAALEKSTFHTARVPDDGRAPKHYRARRRGRRLSSRLAA
jgi:hypothetical protein